MQFFVGFHLKWLIRIALIIFYGACVYYLNLGQNVLAWLAAYHPWFTLALIAVSVFSFFPQFLIVRKTLDGGDVVMRKTYVLLGVIIAFLIALCVYLGYAPFRTAVNSNVLAPLSVMVSGLAVGIYASPWWQTYFAPPLNAFLIGMAVMLVVSIVALKWAKPAVQKVRAPSLPKVSVGYQAQPTPQPVIIQQNPQPTPQPVQQVTTPQPQPQPQQTEETTS